MALKSMSQQDISVALFDEASRLREQNIVLRQALELAISDIESWHEALDETIGSDPAINVLPRLRAALAAADAPALTASQQHTAGSGDGAQP